MLLSRIGLRCVLTVISFCVIGIFSAIQKDVRTDPVGTCSTGLLKHVPESSFSASSVLRNDAEFRPQSAFVVSIYDSKASGKAWCPDMPVSNTPTEWLQVEFNSTKIIKNIFTLGRDDGNYGEYVSNYYFDYQREDGRTWYRYRDGYRGEKIKGNDDARNPAHKTFESPLLAKRIRIIPINTLPNRVCLTIVLYGCDFRDGVVEYRIPRGNGLHDDDSYDGVQFSNKTWLRGGIGKLMDNVIPANSSNQNEIRRFLVAWDRELQRTDHVKLFFRFDRVRKFRAARLYPAIIPSLKLLPFASVTMELSVTEAESAHNTQTVKISHDRVPVEPVISIDMNYKVAKYITITMFFQSRWMGLNEIVFDTVPDAQVYVRPDPMKPQNDVTPNSIHESYPTKVSSKLIMHATLITGITGAFVLISVVTIAIFLWMRQRNRRACKRKLCDYRSMNIKELSYAPNVGNINTITGKNAMLYGLLDTHAFDTSNTIGIRYIHPTYPPCQDYRAHSSNTSNEYEPIDAYWVKPCSVQCGSNTSDAQLEHAERQTLFIPVECDMTHTTSVGNTNGVSSIYGSSSMYSTPPYDHSMSRKDGEPQPYIAQDTFADVYKIHKSIPLKGIIVSSTASCNPTPVSLFWIDSALSRLSEISPTSVVHQKHISDGQFATITSGMIPDCDLGVIVAEMKQTNANSDLRYAFYRQCLLTIKDDYSSHPNLLPLIGVSKRDNTCVSILYGYPSQVNVVTFFEKLRQMPRTNDTNVTCNYVSQSSLLYMAKQLSDALVFLDEASVVHRDVSARNCSIGDKFHLTLSDFAIGLDEFKDDYVSFSPPLSIGADERGASPGAIQLPLLWMPWEAIIMGTFSSKSDVWSFGVTLWEIFTECQLKPYCTSPTVFSNPNPHRHIIKNAMLIASSHRSSILPDGSTIDQTTSASTAGTNNGIGTDFNKHLRDIMYICWQPNPVLRPSFQTLYSILTEFSPEMRYVDEYGSLYHLIS